MKNIFTFNILGRLFLVISLFSSLILSSQTNLYLDDFESYQGFGNIPTNFGGGMKVYATHGTSSSKGLCINFSQFVSKDSAITPASDILPAGCTFQFDYRYATYIGSFPGSGYDLTNDAFEVYAGIAGSGNFGSPLLTINASNHTTSLNFSSQSIDLSAFEGQSVQIKVKGIRGASNDFWLDTDNYKIVSDLTTSICKTQNAIDEILIYPNPTNSVLNINLGTINNPTKVELLNMLGAIVLKKTIYSTTSQLNVEDLPKGIYYLKISGSDKNTLRKVVLK